MRRRPRLLLLTGLVATLVTAGSLPAGAASPSVAPAAGLVISLTGTLAAPCITGTSSGANTKLQVQQRRGSKLVAKAADATGANYRVCLKALKAGDTLVFSKGTKSKTITVPDVRLRLDRGDSRAIGRVPASNPEALVTLLDTIGTFTMTDTLLNGTVAEDGTFSMSTPSQFASDRSGLTWVSPAGHTWYRKAAIPGVIAEVGKAKVTVIGSVGSKRTVTLKAAGGATRATATVTLTKPTAVVTLKQNGNPVTVGADDTVEVNGFPTALELVPDDLAVTTDDGGTFTAHCQPFTRWLAQATTGGEINHTWSGSADVNGLVGTTGAWTDGGSIPTDWTITLDCEDSVGLVQRMVDTVG